MNVFEFLLRLVLVMDEGDVAALLLLAELQAAQVGVGDEQDEQGSALHDPEDRSALELLAELQVAVADHDSEQVLRGASDDV